MLLLLLSLLSLPVSGGTVDFEKPSNDYRVCAYVKNRYVTKAPGLKFERSALKAQSGKYSLEMIGDAPERTFHYVQEIERPAVPGGVQLDFSYFIASSALTIFIPPKNNKIRPINTEAVNIISLP